MKGLMASRQISLQKLKSRGERNLSDERDKIVYSLTDIACRFASHPDRLPINRSSFGYFDVTCFSIKLTKVALCLILVSALSSLNLRNRSTAT